MSSITLTWAGGEHDFLLRIGELRALQKACDAGPEELFNRFRLGTWRIDDALHVLRIGLVGAGMDKTEARRVVGDVLDSGPLVQLKLPALSVLAAALMGVEDDPVGEAEGVEEMPAPENGGSPGSTATAP